MKKRNYWAVFGISAAVAAALITAIILIAGMLEIAGMPASLPITNDPPADGSAQDASTENIKVTSPKPRQKIASPLIISGEAAGWYFEASFPVELKDANGNSLAVGVAQAQGDWMTTDFVPFIATLAFDQPTTLTGTLVLKKDNPSGLPQYDARLEIPVIFDYASFNSDCHPAGCSGEICSDHNVASICIYRASFACYKSAICARQADGQCSWTMTPELQACLDDAERFGLE